MKITRRQHLKSKYLKSIKKLLLILILSSTFNSVAQSFDHDWHQSSKQRHYTAYDVEILNDTVYTLYGVRITDSVDANPSDLAEDWIYSNNPSTTNIMIITKRTTNGNYISSFKVLEAAVYFDVEKFLLEESGKIILYGKGTGLTTDFNPNGSFSGSYTATGSSSNYHFVAFYDLNGINSGHFEFVNYTVRFNDAVVDSDNNLYLAGNFSGMVDFDFTGGVDNHTSNGGNDGFVMKMNLSTQSYLWTKTIGGNNNDALTYIDYNNNKLLLNGTFQAAVLDLDPSGGTYLINHGSDLNADNQFVAVWDNNGVFESGLTLTSFVDTELGGISFDDEGNVYTIGLYYSTDTLNVNPNGTATYLDTTMINVSYETYYILKYNPKLELEWYQSISGSAGNLDLFRDYDKSAIKNAGNYMLVNFSDLNGDMIQSINGGAKNTIASVSDYSALLMVLNKNTGVFEYIDIYEGDNANDNYIYFAETFVLPHNTFYVVGDYYRGIDFNNYDNTTILDSAYGGWDQSPFIMKLNFTGQEWSTDIDKLSSHETQIIVFPNPANSLINIQSKTVIKEFSLIDISGRVLLNQTVNSNIISNLNVSNLNAGVYILIVIDGNGNRNIQKIIKG